jgi:hypothetical protein
MEAIGLELRGLFFLFSERVILPNIFTPFEGLGNHMVVDE